MDGNKRRAVIEAWIDTTISDGGVERLDDLHVDDIDAAWEGQKSWIAAASESFEIAVDLRNQHGKASKLHVLVSIPLESGAVPVGVTFHSRRDLEANLSYIPPSLYLLRSDNKIIREAKAARETGSGGNGSLKLMDATAIIGEMRAPLQCLYSERKRPDDGEYARYIYLIG